jgi:outer membrane protein
MKKVWIIVFGLGYLGLSAQKKWSLKECVSYAVEHNLQVIQNQYTKQNQEYNLKIAKKDLPSVSGSMMNTVSFGQGSFGQEV